MTKIEIIELYLANLNNLLPDSDAKRSRIIDLKDELEALRTHDVVSALNMAFCNLYKRECMGKYCSVAPEPYNCGYLART